MRTKNSSSNSRVGSLILLRVIAFAMIFSSHWLQSLGVGCGGVLGGVGNVIFFLLSGIVLGLKRCRQECPRFGVDFAVGRIRRIYPPFLIVVVIFVLSLILAGYEVSGRQILLNLLMLSWSAKLPSAGHLWFVTGLMAFYGLAMVLSYVRLNRLVVAVILSVLFSGSQYLLWVLGVRQAYFITLLWGGSLTFLYADMIVAQTVKGRKRWILRSVAIGTVLVLLGLVASDCIGMASVPFYWGCRVCAVFISFALLATNTPMADVPQFIGVADKYSYELYLVHHPFCFRGPWCLTGLGFGYTFALILLSSIGALVVHHLSQWFVTFLTRGKND